MKGDMRYTYPIWQMGFILLLISLTTIIGFTSDYVLSNGKDGFLFQISLEGISFWYFAAWLALLVFYLIIFSWKIHKHNKRNPSRQMKIMTLKPQKYMEDDELFEEVTRRATQKVYSYFTVALPFSAAFFFDFTDWEVRDAEHFAATRDWTIFYLLPDNQAVYERGYRAFNDFSISSLFWCGL